MLTDPLQIQPSWLEAQRPREGRYVHGPLLGKGGMGEVVEAWDVVLCRTVALKILRNMEPVALIRFMHEAQIQARVVHPNICRIYDVESSDGTVKIAMQLVRGSTLEQEAPGLPPATVVTLMAQVAEAVHSAHRLNLIHRDLKPSNILLEKGPDDRWTPFICDFGLAMALDEPPLTATNGVIGTPAYMAPEQFHGDRARIGPATDIYGLGGTLYYALRGQPPFGGVTKGAGDPVPGLTPDLERIIRKCLEAEPEDRYPSAAALAEDLWRFLNREPIQAEQPGPVARWRRRNRHLLRALLASAGVAAALAAAWGGGWAIMTRQQTARAAMERLFGREAEDLENGMRMERMLPVHDLRPARNRICVRMEELSRRLASLGPAAAGPGHGALARAHLLLGEFALAETEARLALDRGGPSPERYDLLARAMALGRLEPGATHPDLQDAAFAGQVESLFLRARSLDATLDAYAQGLLAWLRGDYHGAAQDAGVALRERPWDGDGAGLAALSLLAQARQHLEAGDVATAQTTCREAMAVAQRHLDTCPSDEAIHHVYQRSALLLASLLQDEGTQAPAFLLDLDRRCEQALRLDPDHPGCQDDWLGLRNLKAAARLEEGLDPGQDLTSALVFMGTRLREPLPPGLRSTRMQIYWRAAEWDFLRGKDPAPALAEALKDLDQGACLRAESPFRLLVFKARTEAAAGRDPRPTTEDLLVRLRPRLEAHPPWTLQLAAAEAWLIKARWEGGHGQDPAASLAQASALSESALQANPGSAQAQALNGLAHLLESQTSPAKAPVLRMVAQERLTAALALRPHGHLQDELAKALGAAPRARASATHGT